MTLCFVHVTHLTNQIAGTRHCPPKNGSEVEVEVKVEFKMEIQFFTHTVLCISYSTPRRYVADLRPEGL